MSETLTGMFGRYRIERRLGAGAMGAVYLAHDTQLDRPVALKVPKLAPDDPPELLERFVREARAAAALHHPNICPVYDAGILDGRHFMTTGYVAGEPLSEHLRRRAPLSPAEAVLLTRKLAAGLAEAHAHGVIHRDLKPGNVMLDAKHEPVLVDFGLARVISGDADKLTRTGAVMGTPAYMSPEQVDGDLKRLGPRSDVYSLGVMLYEMLTAQLPFTGSIASVLGQIMSREPAPPRSLRPDLPARLERICLQAMAKAPEARFASMLDFSDALSTWNQPDDALVETAPSLKSAAAEGRSDGPQASSLKPQASIVIALAALAMSAYSIKTPAPTPSISLPPPPQVTLIPKPWELPIQRTSTRSILESLGAPAKFGASPLFPLKPLPRTFNQFRLAPPSHTTTAPLHDFTIRRVPLDRLLRPAKSLIGPPSSDIMTTPVSNPPQNR